MRGSIVPLAMNRTAAVLIACVLLGVTGAASPEGPALHSHGGQPQDAAGPKGPALHVDRALVGTWTLVSTEENVDGAQPTRVQAPRGLLIFDAAGHAFELIARAEPVAGRGGRVGRGNAPPAAAATPALTPAQNTFATYSGFWGGYTADAAAKTIAYQPRGAVSPNVMGRAITRSYTFAGDNLVVTSHAGEPHVQGITRWTWERVPNVENLSPTYRKVVGFWLHVNEKRINLTTKTVTQDTARDPSIVVYTPSGYVGVHFPPLNRKKFATDTPTDEEARAALSGLVDYFGALAVYPNMVFHQVLVGISPRGGDTLKRPLELSADGNEVTIKFPVTRNQQGQETTTHVVLRRLSGEADMLPTPTARGGSGAR